MLLAVIGPHWLAAEGDAGRRLDDPQDWVRLEIEAALKRGVRVIPVQIDGARMPAAAELPPSLRDLVRRQAVVLSPASLDIRSLVAVIGAALTDRETEEQQPQMRESDSLQPAQGKTERVRRNPIALNQAREDAFRKTEDRSGEGTALNDLGKALQQAGRLEEAMSAHQQAAAIYREIWDRYGEGTALNDLGNALHRAGRFESAMSAHQQAASIYREIGVTGPGLQANPPGMDA